MLVPLKAFLVFRTSSLFMLALNFTIICLCLSFCFLSILWEMSISCFCNPRVSICPFSVSITFWVVASAVFIPVSGTPLILVLFFRLYCSIPFILESVVSFNDSSSVVIWSLYSAFSAFMVFCSFSLTLWPSKSFSILSIFFLNLSFSSSL